MRIQIYPKWFTAKSMSGELSIDGLFECYFLTLPAGDGLPGSAIPPGLYSVTIAPSPKFQAIAQHDSWFKPYANQIPHIMGIPNRSNILIHVGNAAADTEGCILVGNERWEDFVGGSREAFAQLQPKIVAACKDPLQGCELQMMSTYSNASAIRDAVTGEN